MHGGSGTGGKKRARIEIIPLIDIIFFLLATFIMVSLSMTKNQGMQVALPAGGGGVSSPQDQKPPEIVNLTVTDKGEVLYNNKETITIAQLPMRLQAYKSSSKDPKVVISGAGGASFKDIVAVLDEVRRNGILKVGVNTDKK
jgi:biopolymer transport protein ExbD